MWGEGVSGVHPFLKALGCRESVVEAFSHEIVVAEGVLVLVVLDEVLEVQVLLEVLELQRARMRELVHVDVLDLGEEPALEVALPAGVASGVGEHLEELNGILALGGRREGRL